MPCERVRAKGLEEPDVSQRTRPHMAAANDRFREHLFLIGIYRAPTARVDRAVIKSTTAPPDFSTATRRLASAVASAR
jgi:hypothetical protein